MDSIHASLGRMCPAEDTLVRLRAVPGIGCRPAEVLAEALGTSIERLPAALHFASFAAECLGSSLKERRNGIARFSKQGRKRETSG